MRSSTLALPALLLCAGLAQGQQNFLVNGDFSAGLASWTGSGDGGSPGATLYDTRGTGQDPCFGLQPGGNVYAPPHAPYLLKQQILAMPNVPYELHLDACINGPNGNAQGPYLKFSIGGVVVADWPEFAGSFTAGTYRRHLVLRFTQALVGPQDFAVEFWREKYVWSSSTPWLYIDNLRLTISASPLLRFPYERRLGGTLGLEVVGTAGDTGVVLVSAKEGPGIGVPNFTNSLLLHPAGLTILGAGTLNAQGVFPLNVRIPSDPAIAGVLLCWQGVAVSPAFTGGFSHLHKVCVYP